MKAHSKRIFRLFAVVTLLSGLAFADKDKDKDKEKGGEKGKPAASAAASAEGKHDDAKHDDEDDDDGPADGGKGVSGRRTPAQLTFRKELWEKREKAIEQRVHKNGRKMTDAEREAVKKHWMTIGRLMRIRELAQEDKNDAAVKRVDALLEKKEKAFDAFLEKAETKADGGAK